jgi:hypothetical protein
MYVERRRWWIAMLSTRDHDGVFGVWDGEGDGVLWAWEVSFGRVGVPRQGMLGIEERIVRFDGSYTMS